MQLILKETYCDKQITISPMFPYCDDSKTNLRTILKHMDRLITGDDRKTTKIVSLPVRMCNFEDSNTQEIVFILKTLKGHAREIVKIGDDFSELSEFSKLLNQKKSSDDIEYQTLKVNGKLINN